MLRSAGKVAISAAIMTHPDRRDAAEALRALCGELAPRVMVDPDPSGPPSAWRTARSAWAAVEPGATHHLVLQDDVTLSEGFVEALVASVSARPTDALALFVEWGSRSAGAVRLAAAAGAAWAECADDYTPCVALVLPAADAAEFAAFAAATSTERDPDDVVLLNFLRGRGRRTLAPTEGLVEHDFLSSLVGNSIMGLRRSVRVSAAWSGSVDAVVAVAPRLIPYYDWWDQQAAAFVPDAESPDGWTRIRSGPAFERLGASASSADVSFDAVADSIPGRLRQLVSAIILRELWKTGFLFGVVIGQDGRTEKVVESSTAFDESVATIAPGGLRRIVPTHLLFEVTELVHPLLRAAVVAGRHFAADHHPSTNAAREEATR